MHAMQGIGVLLTAQVNHVTLYFSAIGSTIKCNSSAVVPWILDAVKNCILVSGYICSVLYAVFKYKTVTKYWHMQFCI